MSDPPPRWLEIIIAQLLAKNRNQRPMSAAHVLALIDEYQASRPLGAGSDLESTEPFELDEWNLPKSLGASFTVEDVTRTKAIAQVAQQPSLTGPTKPLLKVPTPDEQPSAAPDLDVGVKELSATDRTDRTRWALVGYLCGFIAGLALGWILFA